MMSKGLPCTAVLLEPFLYKQSPPFWVYCIDGVFVVVGAFDITDEAATQKAFVGFLSKHAALQTIAHNTPKSSQQNPSQAKSKPLRIDEKAIEPIYLLALCGDNVLLLGDLLLQGFDDDCFCEALGLPSASDFLAFLSYRQYLLQEGLDTKGAQTQFMYSPIFFQRAWRTEKHLQKYDYMVRVSPAIKSAIYKNQSVIKNLVERQCSLAPLWQRMVARFLERTGNVAIAQKLQAQSAYTAMKIVEFVLGYVCFDANQKAEGKISHEHSYHRVGQHFVLIAYGTDASSPFSAWHIHNDHELILSYYQTELTKKAQEIFLLGFDLSQKDEQGNIVVNMDVWSAGI